MKKISYQPCFNLKKAVVSDFDGTITETDVGDFLLLHFSLVTERDVRLAYELNKPVEKWMQKYFSRISAIPKKEIEKAILKHIKIKKWFKKSVLKAKTKKIPFEIVSGGVDLYSKPIFKKEGLKIKSFFGKYKEKKSKASITYPHLKGKSLSEFKAKRVLAYKNKGFFTIFCGDAPNDFLAAKKADMVFADSRLYKMCKNNKIKCFPLKNFIKLYKTL